MKNKIVKKLTALILAVSLCSGLAGCQGGSGTVGSNDGGSDAQESGALVSGNIEGSTGMGRYVEQEVDLGKKIEGTSCMIRDGGKISFLGMENLFESEDNGASWNERSMEWYQELNVNAYVMEMAIAADGTIAVQYSPNDGENAEKLEPRLMTVSSDGKKKEIPVKFTEDEMFARELCYTQDGRLIAVTFNKGVYEVNVETGAFERICTPESNPMYAASQGRLLLLACNDGLVIYDMEAKSFVEDEVLDGFIKETYNAPDDYGNCYNLYAFFGEENIIYIAGKKGLHRHVIGGGAIEQVIEAGLSSFGNPSREIVHAITLENNEFLAQFSDGSLVRFYYDASVPTVPSEKLKVYSLKENDTVKQAIAAYQKANPNMLVEYEAVLGFGGNGITREDALKNLSTAIMNGEGPDVLILDDMPIDAYADKGILLDISDVYDEVKNSSGAYENLFVPFRKNGGMYVMPVEFQLPFVVGREKDMENVKDYKGYAQAIKALREENPKGKIINECNDNSIIRRFIPTCAPAWKNEDKSLNRDAVKEFLEQTKIIYDAQMSGLSQKEISDYQDTSVYSGDIGGDLDYDYTFYSKMIDDSFYMAKYIMTAIGNVYSKDTLASVLSVPKVEGREDSVVSLFDGQSANVYSPVTLAGVSAQSKHIEASKDFLKMMFSDEIQTNTFKGLPVTKSGFEKMLSWWDEKAKENDEAIYMMYGMSDQDGNSFTWEVHWFDEAQKQQIREWASQAKTPYIEDSMLENAVARGCMEYLRERRSLDEAMAEIEKSVRIYLSE